MKGETNKLSPRLQIELSSSLSENTEYISTLHGAVKAKQTSQQGKKTHTEFNGWPPLIFVLALRKLHFCSRN